MPRNEMAIELTPLHPTLGAELRGVDLTRPVMPDYMRLTKRRPPASVEHGLSAQHARI
jgi:hypothetical protein